MLLGLAGEAETGVKSRAAHLSNNLRLGGTAENVSFDNRQDDQTSSSPSQTKNESIFTVVCLN
jgi:hypothetical protein